jgi:hypothetical protein
MTKDLAVDGETHAYQLLTYEDSSEEKSREKSSETYVEVYVSAEAGLETGAGTVKVGGKYGGKWSWKETAKSSKRKGDRIASQVSKSYVLQKLARNVLTFSKDGEYFILQHEYLVQRKDVGDVLGPFVPDYDTDGFVVAGSARGKALEQLDALLLEAASDLATRPVRR